MDLSIDLPVAGGGVPILLLLVVGLLVGGLSGFYGVGAGLLLTPLLMVIGIPPPVAVATCANHVVATSAPGAIAHVRSRAVDGKMFLLMLAGALLGGAAGVQLIRVLRVAGHADLVITLVYVALLGGLGLLILRDGLHELRGEKPVRRRRAARRPRPPLLTRILDRLPIRTEFPRSQVRHSALTPVFAGGLVGLLTAITGIGGGFVLVPIAVYLLGLPVHLAVGSSLLLVFASCANVTVQHALFNRSVDAILALVLVVATVVGAQIGGRVARRLRPDQVRILLAVIVLFTALKLAMGVLLPPDVAVLATAPEGGP